MLFIVSEVKVQMVSQSRSTTFSKVANTSLRKPVIRSSFHTFTTLTMAIINVIRYRKFNSPILSAAKAISLAAACVSMLTLENTMLASFNKGTLSQKTIRIFLALSGGAVSAFIVGMAVYMIVQANRKLKSLEGYNDGR